MLLLDECGSSTAGMKDLKAVECLMNKIVNERGLVASSYTAHAPCSTGDSPAHLPALGGDRLLVKFRWSRERIRKTVKGVRNRKTLPRSTTCRNTCFQVPGGKAPCKSIRIYYPHFDQPPDLDIVRFWRLKASNCGDY